MTRERDEQRILDLARGFSYPPCPDLGPAVLARLPARPPRRARMRPAAVALSLLVVVLGLLLAVPTVRAAVFEVLEVGIVRILLGAQRTPAGAPAISTPSLSGAAFDLAGQVTLEEARTRFPLPIRLPTYPADVGDPDLVYLQDLDGAAVILVWLDPRDPARAVFSFQAFTDDSSIWKLDPELVATSRVNGREAYWTSGPYLLVTASGERESVRLVEGHVLIWTEGGLTYRLEGDLGLDEAVRMAESLR